MARLQALEGENARLTQNLAELEPLPTELSDARSRHARADFPCVFFFFFFPPFFFSFFRFLERFEKGHGSDFSLARRRLKVVENELGETRHACDTAQRAQVEAPKHSARLYFRV